MKKIFIENSKNGRQFGGEFTDETYQAWIDSCKANKSWGENESDYTITVTEVIPDPNIIAKTARKAKAKTHKGKINITKEEQAEINDALIDLLGE